MASGIVFEFDASRHAVISFAWLGSPPSLATRKGANVEGAQLPE